VEIFGYFGAAFPCADGGEILQSQADPCAPRLCHISRESVQSAPLEGEKPDFWPVSKFNTGSLPLCNILPVKTYKHHIFAPTVDARCTIFPKLCMVIELVVTIKNGGNHFLIQRILFPTGWTEKFGVND